MARQRKTINRTNRNAKSNPRPYHRGVLIVHGIGQSKPGDTLQLLGQSIVTGITEAGVDARCGDTISEDRVPRKLVEIVGRQSVLVAEAHWADALPTLHGFDAQRIGRQFHALARMAPFLLIGALGPRTHEPDPMSLDPSTSFSKQFRILAPMLWRMSTLVGVIVGLALLAGLGLSKPWVGALLGGAVIAFLLFLGMSKLIGQVRIAALEDDEIAPALTRIREAIAQVEATCDEVWVLAHSQGGYLAHRVLAEDGPNAHPRVKRFTGIASGLRPIHLASTTRSVRWAVQGWLSLLSSMCFFAFGLLIISPGGILSASSLTLLFAGFLPFLVVPAALLDTSLLLEQLGSMHEAAVAGLAWTYQDTVRIALAAAGVAAILAAYWIRKHALPFQAIRDLGRRIRWEELSSRSDLVGSMSVPPLPGKVHAVSLPALRNPIGDHLLSRLLRGPSALRVLICERLLGKASLGANQAPSRFSPLLGSLNRQSDRSYRLRGLLLACTLGLTLGFPVALGVAPIDLVARPPLYASYVAVSVVSMGVSAAWWGLSARQRMRAYRNGTPYPNTHEVSRTYLRWLWIAAWALVLSAFTIQWFTLLDGQRQGSLVGSLMCLGLVLLLTACLAEVQVHVPRTLLWMVLALFPAREIAQILGPSGSGLDLIWIVLGTPGTLLGLGCLALAVVALVTKRRAPR